jgi:hypothetical protein
VPAGQIHVQVPQMLLQILHGFALGHVLRIVLQITEPELAILPGAITATTTSSSIRVKLEFRLCEPCSGEERWRVLIPHLHVFIGGLCQACWGVGG